MLHGGTLNNPPSKASIEGFAKGLSQIASVADAAARAALVSGLTVTAANPVWVHRRDTGAIERFDGTRWQQWTAANFAGGEPNWFSGTAPAGQPMVVAEWVGSGTVGGGGGGVVFPFPRTFVGITSVQYSCMQQNTRLSYWSMNASQLMCTSTNLTGSTPTPDGTVVWASLRIVGW